MSCELTIERARKILDERFGGVLRIGQHGNCNSEVCVRELRAIACGLHPTGHPDDPHNPSPTDRAWQTLNDAPWSSAQARTTHCLIGATMAEEFAAPGWVEMYIIATIREILPIALGAAGLTDHAASCRNVRTLAEGQGSAAAAWAAAEEEAAWAEEEAGAAWAEEEAGAARWAAEAGAARWAAAEAATAAAEAAAEADKVLILAVSILVQCHRGEYVIA